MNLDHLQRLEHRVYTWGIDVLTILPMGNLASSLGTLGFPLKPFTSELATGERAVTTVPGFWCRHQVTKETIDEPDEYTLHRTRNP